MFCALTELQRKMYQRVLALPHYKLLLSYAEARNLDIQTQTKKKEGKR